MRGVMRPATLRRARTPRVLSIARSARSHVRPAAARSFCSRPVPTTPSGRASAARSMPAAVSPTSAVAAAAASRHRAPASAARECSTAPIARVASVRHAAAL
eukprot:1256932-Prymnesium_polylepis.1